MSQVRVLPVAFSEAVLYGYFDVDKRISHLTVNQTNVGSNPTIGFKNQPYEIFSENWRNRNVKNGKVSN